MNTELLDSDSEDEMPPGWEERACADGIILYVNHIDKTTQWFHPRTGKKKTYQKALPFGWEKTVGNDGKVVYHDTFRKVSSFIDPRLSLTHECITSINDIRFKYDGYTTALEVLHGADLTDYVAIVTGANSGVGFETARSLALHGCTVVFACSTIKKAEIAAGKVRTEKASLNCVPMELNLASIDNIKNFVSQFKFKFRKLNILILNAAVFWLPYVLTKDYYEATFQICHLGHFYLTTSLEDRFTNTIYSRIIVVSCESHRFSDVTKENLHAKILLVNEANYSKVMAYNNAKLFNILFANELHNRYHWKYGVQVFAVHPGNLICTSIMRHCCWPLRLLFSICRLFTKSLQQAASTAVFCATSHLLDDISGIYLNNCFPCPPSNTAKDNEMAKDLWLISETLVERALIRDGRVTTQFPSKLI